MVPLSWFIKKNENLNLGKKSSFCIENGTFYLKLSVIKLKSSIFSTKWTFFPQIQISIFLHKSTQWDHSTEGLFMQILFKSIVGQPWGQLGCQKMRKSVRNWNLSSYCSTFNSELNKLWKTARSMQKLQKRMISE